MSFVPMDVVERISLQTQEFRLFEEGNVLEFRRQALAGKLRRSHLRSVAWKVFLEVVPENASCWSEVLKEERALYDKHTKELWIDPHQLEDEDVTVNNPLSQESNSVWNKFFQNKELQQEIQKDLDRLYPEYDFFQLEDTKEKMMRVLFVWSTLNSDTSYRQGMHELLAPMIWLTSVESMGNSDNSTMATMLDSRFVEHDAFALFSKLMDTMKEFFEVTDRNNKNNGLSEGTQTPILQKCQRVFGSLLKSRDPDLYKHLVALEIEPQLFLLRWVRCLFSREFHLQDVMVLWDAIFADSPTLMLGDFICVAMLKFIRSDLLGRDVNFCLRRLMRYPPVEDVGTFIEQAQLLRSSTPGRRASQIAAQQPTDARPDSLLAPIGKKALMSIPGKLSMRLGVRLNDDHTQEELLHHVKQWEDMHARIAEKLNGIVAVLEKSSSASENFQETQVHVSIAQLKQIKDVLTNALPMENIDLIETLEQQETAAKDSEPPLNLAPQLNNNNDIGGDDESSGDEQVGTRVVPQPESAQPEPTTRQQPGGGGGEEMPKPKRRPQTAAVPKITSTTNTSTAKRKGRSTVKKPTVLEESALQDLFDTPGQDSGLFGGSASKGKKATGKKNVYSGDLFGEPTTTSDKDDLFS